MNRSVLRICVPNGNAQYESRRHDTALLESDVKKSRLAISNTDLYLNTPFETRASEALLFNSSPSMINRDTTASNVDAALAGDLDFFERDLIGRLLGEAKRTQESTASSAGTETLLGISNPQEH